jgi:hypothetical protein
LLIIFWIGTHVFFSSRVSLRLWSYLFLHSWDDNATTPSLWVQMESCYLFVHLCLLSSWETGIRYHNWLGRCSWSGVGSLCNLVQVDWKHCHLVLPFSCTWSFRTKKPIIPKSLPVTL